MLPGWIYLHFCSTPVRQESELNALWRTEGTRRNRGVSNKNSDHFHARAVCRCCFPLWLWIKNDKEPIYSNLQLQQVQRYCGSAFLSHDDSRSWIQKLLENKCQREVSDNATPPNQTSCVNWQRGLPESAMMSCPILSMHLTSYTNW